ncbi:MAG: TIGR00730 family Rossman fold protein [Alphaproteobacteria bacterium]|nr:TIGR00730 family Rossman fold protein [Alphaproteobacteria bacterium]
MSIFKKQISVCVFCGAQIGNKKKFQDIATEVGNLIAKNNMRLVYGAGGTGLMGKVAYGVLDLKGKIFGITTKIIADFEKPIKGTKFKIVKNIQLRKRGFIDNSDAFIVTPGGFGTFDELFEILVSKEVIEKHNKLFGSKDSANIVKKPLVLVDVDGFFKPFEKLVDSLIANGFMPETNKKYFKIVKTPKEAVNYIKKYIKK